MHGKMNARKRVFETIAKTLMISELSIRNDDRLIEDLGADSLHSVELVAALEEEFNIEFNKKEIMKAKTVYDVLSFVSQFGE